MWETYDADGKAVGANGVNKIYTVDIKPLLNNKLVVAEKRIVHVFDLEDYTSNEVCWQFGTESDVAVVFQGVLRDQIGILDTQGQVTLHTIAR